MVQLYLLNQKKNGIKISHSEYCINLHTKQNKELTDKIDIEEFQKIRRIFNFFLFKKAYSKI